MIRCGWGTERNRNAGSAVAAILALPAVAGKFGVRGGGYTMSNSPAWRDIDEGAAAAARQPPTRAVNMNQLGAALTELDAPPVKALFVYNANPLATIPNQEKVRAGLARDDLFTVVFDAVGRTRPALPTSCCRRRRSWSTTSWRAATGPTCCRRRVRSCPPRVRRVRTTPCSASWSGVWACGARAIPREPEALHRRPAGEHARRAAPARGAGARRPRRAGVRRDAGAVRRRLSAKPGGKIDLCPRALDRMAPDGLYGYRPDPATAAAPLALISPASSHTISSTLRPAGARAVPIELAPEDARQRGIADGDRVRVWNALGEVRCRAVVNPDLRAGVAMLPKGLWSRHTENGATANALCPDTLTDLGGGACFNDARVEVQRLDDR